VKKPISVGLLLFALTGCFPAPEKLCLASQITGVVTKDGGPISGIVVERKIHSRWHEETQTQRAVSDPKGRFSLPAVTKDVVLQFLHQPVVEQQIFVILGGVPTKTLGFTKMDYSPMSETKGVHIETPGKSRFSSLSDRYFLELELNDFSRN